MASKQHSRFSTLKVFKFTRTDTSRPPTPPPKDPYYLQTYTANNRSLASLSPDSLSIPSTPHSPHFNYGKTTADATQSAVSLVSTSDPDDRRKKSGKPRSVFNFGRKSSKGSNAGSEEPPPQEDENISMPWNFQHHIHVDEAYVGLPPSWTASLQEAGFSEHEIQAIQERRTPPTPSINLTSDRSRSPVQGPVVRPLPRSTSLPRRQFSSSTTLARGPGQNAPPIPALRASPTPSSNSSKRTPPRQFSEPTHGQTHQPQVSGASSFSIEQYQQVNAGSFSSDDQYVYVEKDTIPSTSGHGHSRGPSRSVSSAASSRSGSVRSKRSQASDRGRVRDTIMPMPPPQTPPRTSSKKGFHVVNGSSPSGQHSPPPAYWSPAHGGGGGSGSGWPNEKQAGTSSSQQKQNQQNSHSSHLDKAELDSEGSDDEVYSEESGNSVVESLGNHSKERPRKRMSAIPPRLSFHESGGDWDGWAESLMNSMPGVDDVKGKKHHKQSSISRKHEKQTSSSSTSRRHQKQPSTSSTSRKHDRKPSTSSTSQRHERQPSSSRCPPPKPITISQEEDLPHLVTPLWNELMGLVSSPPSQSSSGDGEWTPALSETQSPILPGMRSSSGTFGSSQDEGDAYLGVDRNKDRDSGMSVSTVTGIDTDAVVVSGVRAFGTKAVALERSPTKGGSLMPPSPLGGDNDESWVMEMTESDTLPNRSHFSDDSIMLSNSIQGVLKIDPNRPPKSPGLETPTSSEPGLAYMQLSATEVLLDSGAYDGEGETMKSPSIVLQATDGPPQPATPLTPARTYPGWVSGVVAPIEEFIDKRVNPRDHYMELTEIAEGESGSVYAARVVNADKLRLRPPLTSPPPTTVLDGIVAIKNVPILPGGSPKLDDLEKELKLMKGARHQNLLEMDQLYVDIAEDSLWIRMELMEKSLADVVQLVQEGLMVQERMIARFASDAILGLEYLQTQHIAHRDLRSDNLLLNRDGILKIADFSSAVKVIPETPTCSDPAGVIYWQAPEIRRGPYNALKVDVWSIGATVWEMAQTEPPFSDIQDPTQIGEQWPPLSQPELYSRSFHDFLRSCSQPSSIRPDPPELLNSPFIQNACGRQVVIQLLSQCRAIEERMVEWDRADLGAQGQGQSHYS